jgi:hypothetical protein
MIKRIASVSMAVAVLTGSAWIAGSAEARSSRGASASRACLTSAARNLLSRIEQRFGAVQLISTCRPGARIAGTNRISRHASGNAIDFSAGGRKSAIVNWLIANHRSGGTMTYATMSHIHVDIGHHFVALNSGGRSRVASSSRRWSNRMALGASKSRRSAAGRSYQRTRSSERYEAEPARRSQGSARHASEPSRQYGIDEPKG